MHHNAVIGHCAGEPMLLLVRDMRLHPMRCRLVGLGFSTFYMLLRQSGLPRVPFRAIA